MRKAMCRVPYGRRLPGRRRQAGERSGAEIANIDIVLEKDGLGLRLHLHNSNTSSAEVSS